MGKINTTMIVMIILIIVSFILNHIMKNHVINNLFEAIKNKDMEQYDKLSKKFLYRYYIPAYNIEYMRLQGYILNQDIKNTDLQFSKLLEMRKNKKQEIDLYTKSFYYYIQIENKKKSEEMLEKVKTVCAEEEIKLCQIAYDVILCGKYNHIEEIEKEYQDAPEQLKTTLNYYLYLQYKNKGDLEKAEIYKKKFENFAKDQEIKFK